MKRKFSPNTISVQQALQRERRELIKYASLQIEIGKPFPKDLIPEKCCESFNLQTYLFKKFGCLNQLFSNEILPKVDERGVIVGYIKRDRTKPFPMIDVNEEKQGAAMRVENLHNPFGFHKDTRSHDEMVLFRLNGDDNLGVDRSEQLGFAGIGK